MRCGGVGRFWVLPHKSVMKPSSSPLAHQSRPEAVRRLRALPQARRQRAMQVQHLYQALPRHPLQRHVVLQNLHAQAVCV